MKTPWFRMLAESIFVTRFIPALVLYGLGIWLMASRLEDRLDATPSIMLGMCMFVISATLIGPSVTRALVEWVAKLVSCSETSDQASPMYSIPSNHRKQARYEEAMTAYQQIAEHFPNELKPHMEMISIALHDLKDADRAERIYQQALLLFPDVNSRERLARLMSGFRIRAKQDQL